LLTCDNDSGAETLGAWWQLAHPVFSRVLIAQHRRCFGIGRDHQEGLILVPRRGINALDPPLPCPIREDLPLRINQPTKRLRFHAHEHVLLRVQSSQHTFYGDLLTHGGSMARSGNTRGGGGCGGESRWRRPSWGRCRG